MRARPAILAALAFVFALLSAFRAEAEPAKRVYAGIYLHDVTKFEQKDGVFDADLELWVKWLDDFDPSNLVIANAAEVEQEKIGEESDGRWHSIRWRVKGTLRGEFPVHNFPFDQQTLAVVLELPEADGELVPDLAGSGMRERFSVTGWHYEPSFVPRISEEIYRSDLGSIATEGSPTKVRRAAFEVTMTRPLLTASTKLFLPLLVILLVALVALFVHPSELEVRASVGVTALLACFAFHFAVSDTMPNVSYITLADVLFLASYALTAVLLIVSVMAYALHSKGRELAWRRLDIGALLGFPIILFTVIFLALPAAREAHATTSQLDSERPPSARDSLRVGTNVINSPMGGLASRGATWGTVRTAIDNTRTPGLAEQVPSITNDALRFLADGRLEVTWKLRPNLKWSDGKPLTADDLDFALKVSPDPRIDEVRVASPRELVVRFKDRVAAALDNITPLPKHALEDAYKSGGFDAVREFRRNNVLPASGPYMVTDFKMNDHLFLEKNPHFAGAPPSIGRIQILRYESDEALIAAFEKGEIDMILPNAIAPEAALALARRRPDAVLMRPSEIQCFLHPDLANPLLAKREVRRAILQAIDRGRVRAEVFGTAAEHALESHIPVPGDEPEGTERVAFDPEAARKTLEQAGAAGTKMPLIHGPTPFDKGVAAQLVRELGAVGITLEPKEVPIVFDVYRQRKHGGLLLHALTGDRDLAPERVWNLPQVQGKFDRTFRSDAYDDAVNALVLREERALYPERREQIRDRLFAEYSQRLPMIPLFFLADRIVAVPALDGWDRGSGINFGTTVEQWHFAAAE
jgi:peptide/nickel transport system substrate-binding protein